MRALGWKATAAAAVVIVAAAAIAGQLGEGAGMPVVAAGTLGWTVFAISRVPTP